MLMFLMGEKPQLIDVTQEIADLRYEVISWRLRYEPHKPTPASDARKSQRGHAPCPEAGWNGAIHAHQTLEIVAA